MIPSSDRCSLRSEAAGELMPGTASTVRRWLLVEHDGPWGRDGLLDGRLPDGLGARLRRSGERNGWRVVLIRRPDRRAHRETRCFAVDTSADGPWLGHVVLQRIEDAVALDPRDRFAFEPDDEPLAVVCTHGRRDPCCAERGRPLAQATFAAFPDRTWESSHIGGDRFAANMVLFPHGLYFGRVEAVRGPEIVGAYREGRIVLDRFRGRSSFPMPIQAAEQHVRAALDLDALEATSLVGHRTDDGAVTAVFDVADEGSYEVMVRRGVGDPMRLTCHAADEQPTVRWELETINPRP
jgi:hypothetical protein